MQFRLRGVSLLAFDAKAQVPLFVASLVFTLALESESSSVAHLKFNATAPVLVHRQDQVFQLLVRQVLRAHNAGFTVITRVCLDGRTVAAFECCGSSTAPTAIMR